MAAGLRARAKGGLLRIDITVSAYQRLHDLIVSGRLAPGTPLVETDLSARLGVSRTPVRAALQRLLQEGFVTAQPAGQMLRASVAPLTAADMREVFLITGALEAAGARLAAALEAPQREALADELARLADLLHQAAADRPPDLLRAQDLHACFHRTYATAAAGPRLIAELEVLQPQAERYERVYTTAIISAFDEAERERAAIIEALRRGDADAVETAVSRTWRGAVERYARVVTILGERGNW
ncbi:MAG TPA: GntR family transcriptional regulator [Vicinamibacterales bacterium]